MRLPAPVRNVARMATGSASEYGSTVSTTRPASPWRASGARRGRTSTYGNPLRSAAVAPVARMKSSAPTLTMRYRRARGRQDHDVNPRPSPIERLGEGAGAALHMPVRLPVAIRDELDDAPVEPHVVKVGEETCEALDVPRIDPGEPDGGEPELGDGKSLLFAFDRPERLVTVQHAIKGGEGEV